MSSAWLLTVMASAPIVAMLLIAALRHHAAAVAWINLLSSVVVLAGAGPLPWIARARTHVLLDGYVLLDGLAAWTVLCTALVYLLASIFAVDYMRMHGEPERLARFYALFAGFALTTLVAPLMNNAGIYWIAIELTTLVSTFLVAFEQTAPSIEAAWKYILFYWNASFTLGPTFQLTWAALRGAAPHLHPHLLLMSFLLVLIGYGTKVGLVPMHTWLPDAHSEGPTPVSALLSGALLNAAMVGVVRFLTVTDAGGEGHAGHMALVAFGAASLLLSAFAILRQERIKRLMAYSSVEHMGVIALGFGFGGPRATAGALYHMLNHSLNKALMFFGAGAMIEAYGTDRIVRITRVLRRFPVLGAAWLAGAVAITGAPPFGLFASELTILRGGLASHMAWAVILMAVLLILIFAGFLGQFATMYFGGDAGQGPDVRDVGAMCVLPMLLAIAALLVLGVWWPDWLWGFFGTVSAQLGQGAAP